MLGATCETVEYWIKYNLICVFQWNNYWKIKAILFRLSLEIPPELWKRKCLISEDSLVFRYKDLIKV